MAAFPFGRPAGSGMGSSALDAPPPNPMNPSFSDLQNPGQVGGTGLGAPARQLPPEVLMGFLKIVETMSGQIDDMAQMAPDIAPELAASKDLLQRAASKLVVAGGAPSTISAPGREFPGSAPFPSQSGVPA